MGNTTTQEIDRFISNNVNTTAISEVISSYATSTNSISNNVQDVSINVRGSTIEGPINVSQEIQSYIDVEQLLDRSNITELTNDIEQVVSTEIKDAIMRTTDGIEFLSNPLNQALRERVLSQIDNYTRQVVNTSRIDDLLLSASNYQKGNLVVDQSMVNGPIVFTQRIQSNMMASNIVRDVLAVSLQNRDVQQLYTVTDTTIQSENISPITTAVRATGGLFSGGITSWLFYIGAILVLIIGFLIAFFLPALPTIKIAIGVISFVIALVLLFIGLFISNRKAAVAVTPPVGKAKRS